MKNSKSKKAGERTNATDGDLEDEDEHSSESSTISDRNNNNALRTHSRKSQFGPPQPTTENIEELKTQIEEFEQKIEEKEKELSGVMSEKSKVDSVVNKLNMDVRATHLLIESLQKESLYHTQNREKLVTGNSLFAKHQKKIKVVKDQINTINTENEELKKEIAALGGDITTLMKEIQDKKKKKKH